MNSKDKIDIQKINNSREKEILMYLDQEGKSIYGEIIRNLQLSATKGQEAIYSLMNKGLIRHRVNSSFIELNVELT